MTVDLFRVMLAWILRRMVWRQAISTLRTLTLLALAVPAAGATTFPKWWVFSNLDGGYAFVNKAGSAAGVCNEAGAWLIATHGGGHYTAYVTGLTLTNASDGAVRCDITITAGTSDAGYTFVGPVYASFGLTPTCDARALAVNGACEPPHEDRSCGISNPTLPGSGCKAQGEDDYVGAGAHALNLRRYYRSAWADGLKVGMSSSDDWSSGWKLSVQAQLSSELADRAVGAIRALRPDGSIVTFNAASGTARPRSWSTNATRDQLTELASAGSTTGWQLKNFDDDSVETYSTAGQLQTIVARNGWLTRFGYNTAGQLVSVKNHFGRELTFAYDGAGRVSFMTAPGGQITQYGYDVASNLGSVTWPDGNLRRYHYEDSRFPHALTGVTDELGVRVGTYGYETGGRTSSTVKAGGVDRVQFQYSPDLVRTVVAEYSTGTARNVTYTFANQAGVMRPTTASASCSLCGNTAQATEYDAAGNKTKEVAHDGSVTFYAYDAIGRETERAVFASGYQNSSPRPALNLATSVTSTKWHATWKLPTQIAEAGKVTTYTYDSKGNLSGQSWAATTDPTGALAFAATKTGSTYTTGWGYNASSLNTSVVQKTDAIETGRWTSTYNTLGDATSTKDVTNSRTAKMTQYDARGNMLAGTTDVGVPISLGYSPRGFIVRKTVNGQAVAFTLTAVGNMAQATTPDGQVIDYVLDANQVLIDVKLNGVSITPQMLALAEYPDTPLKAQIAKARAWLTVAVESLMREAHAQPVIVPGLRPSGQPEFDPRTDMLMSPMTKGDEAARTFAEQTVRMCQCDPSGGYAKPTLTAGAYVHLLRGGHLGPVFSDQSYFTVPVRQTLVDEVVQRSTMSGAFVDRRNPNRTVYNVPMGRPVGMFNSGLTVSPVTFASTEWVRLVVEVSNCSGRRSRNEIITFFPQPKPK